MPLLEIAGQLKTFTEQSRDEAADEAIRGHIQEAGTIVFLGFAFHDLNMSLLEHRHVGWNRGKGIPPRDEV